MGIRQMELVNKFDNALAGVAGDGGVIGPVVNSANFRETGRFWQMRDVHRPRGRPRPHRRSPNTGEIPAQDAIFGASDGCRRSASRRAPRPSIRPGPHCNPRAHRPRRVPAPGDGQAQDDLRPRPHERARAQPGARLHGARRTTAGSSPATAGRRRTASPRSTRRAASSRPYAGGSAGFVHAWQDTKPLRDKRYYFGIGYGADANGFGAQGGPRDLALAPPGHLSVPLLRRLGRARATDERRARLRHQHRRRRPLRPLPRLDRGPADDRRRRDRQGHGPRRRGLPADVGARRGRPRPRLPLHPRPLHRLRPRRAPPRRQAEAAA